MANEVTKYQGNQQISLIKMSDDEIAEIIRPEENLERLSSYIFPLPTAFNLREERSLSNPNNDSEPVIVNGKQLETTLTITPSVSHDCYTYKSYPVYKAVVAIWNDRGLPETPFLTSLSEIAKRMGVGRGGVYLSGIEKELHSLYHTNISWVFCFEGEKPNQSLKNKRILETFNYNRLDERIDDSDRFDAVVELQLSYFLRQQHREGRTIPVNWTTLKSITSPSIRIIFNEIDSLLAVHSYNERRLQGLIRDLRLTADRYKYKSQRKAFAEKIKKQLNGKRLSSLQILVVDIEETADEKDYKCIFRRVSDDNFKALAHEKKTTKKKSNKNNLKVANTDKDHCKYLAQTIADIVGEGDKNKKLYALYARHYSENLIFRALGYFKESKSMPGTTIESFGAYFSDTLHRLAHETGSQWILDCGKHCPQRKENRLPGM